ncbi:hypothetical protein BGZ83_000970 [Gryganskiella cystojenkinii]|nr:hypothetical protein BGZ83_000970 [Gryganskiella cystojenkinii]
MFNLLFVLYFIYFPPHKKVNALIHNLHLVCLPSRSFEWAITLLFSKIILGHLLVCTLLTIVLLAIFGRGDQEGAFGHWTLILWAGILGIINMLLSLIQYIPQLIELFLRKSVGALSIPMMLIQTPCTILLTVSIALRPEANWTSWIVYAFSSFFQIVLLGQCIYYRIRAKKMGYSSFAVAAERTPLLAAIRRDRSEETTRMLTPEQQQQQYGTMAEGHDEEGAMAALNHVKKVWSNFLSQGGYDAHALSGLKLVSASKGSCVAELQVTEKHLNRLGGCHGGLLSTIVDVGGSLAIAAKDMHATGVSTDLNVSFVSGATLGDTLVINSRCDRVGGSLAYTTVEISVEDKTVALGRHTKFVRLAHKANKNMKLDVKCGGTVKPLVEADIAFVSDETSRNDLDNNGESGSSSSQRTKARTATTRLSMTILRPEWIVDSISGQRRASLGRYKRSFPPLRRCDSSSFQGDDDEERGEQGSGNQQHQLLSGMEAFRSKNFLSFSPSSSSSVPLYQPVSEFHDLSLISNSSNSNIYDTRHNAALNTNINTSSSNRFSPFGLSSTSSPLGPSQRTLPLLENQRASSHGRDSDADATDIDIRSQIRGFDQFIHDNTMGYDESAEGGFIPTTQNWDDPSPSSSSFLSMRRTTMSMMMERTTEPLSPVLHLTDSPFSPLPGPEPSRTAQQCQKRAPVFQQDGDAEEGETAVMVFVSDHLTPEMPIARKRRLPETVLRTKSLCIEKQVLSQWANLCMAPSTPSEIPNMNSILSLTPRNLHMWMNSYSTVRNKAIASAYAEEKKK